MAFSALVDEVLDSHKRSSRYGARVARIIVHHWAGTSGGMGVPERAAAYLTGEWSKAWGQPKLQLSTLRRQQARR